MNSNFNSNDATVFAEQFSSASAAIVQQMIRANINKAKANGKDIILSLDLIQFGSVSTNTYVAMTFASREGVCFYPNQVL